jgi:hypothetical protein
MVDMGDDREIADVLDGRRGHAAQITPAPRSGKRSSCRADTTPSPRVRGEGGVRGPLRWAQDRG